MRCFCPARKPVAALADDRFVAVVEAFDKLVRVCGLCGRYDFVASGVGTRDENVVVDSVVEQNGILRNAAEIFDEIGGSNVAQIDAVDFHRA